MWCVCEFVSVAVWDGGDVAPHQALDLDGAAECGIAECSTFPAAVSPTRATQRYPNLTRHVTPFPSGVEPQVARRRRNAHLSIPEDERGNDVAPGAAHGSCRRGKVYERVKRP